MIISKIFAFVFYLLLGFCLAGTCGTNCPSNTCQKCICGNSKSTINLTTFCKLYTWDQKCCQCIATRVSNSNQRFMSDARYFYQIGIMGIDEDKAASCNMAPKDLCDYKNNAKCAYERYIDAGKTWSYWSDEAFACGCSVYLHQSEDTQIQQKHLENEQRWRLKNSLIINQ